MTFNDVAKRWESAPIAYRTAKEIYELTFSSHFYNFNSFCWDGQPKPVDGEVGYDDKTRERIVLK